MKLTGTFTLFLCLFFKVLYSDVYAQNKLHVGIEIGPKQEHFTYEDPNRLMYQKEYRHTIKGISISYELNKDYSLESGLYSNPQTTNVNTTIAPMYYGWNRPDRMLQIPIRLSRELYVINSKLSLRGQIGASYSYNYRANCPTQECYISSELYSSEIGNNGTSDFPYFEAKVYALNKHAWLGEAGISLNYKLKPKLNLALAASYYHGFRDITRIYSAWHEDESTKITAFSYSKGSSTNFLLKLSYQLFDFSKPKNPPDEYFKN
ncbi:outer membrane beta-barrel protein [uncultured Pontibacter sp.]|uniref:outer membrane beta-barrel protein n=1 Tax=uncultured Pontibacter sp. TaxID=453356 RepID=UPI00262ABA3E|nr:outer membrane beta-barrel protein [uncultured Pontibacter sp.]